MSSDGPREPATSRKVNSGSPNRDSFIFYGPDGELMSVKWRTIKAIFRYQEGMTQVITTPRFPMLYDLRDDPGERSNLWETRMDTTWMLAPVFQRISAPT
jgi:arylsulfatase